MATPNDHIDMKKRTKATALATHVIWFHMSIRLRPPSIVLSSGVKCCLGDLLERELHRDGHDDRNRYAVEQRGRELPLFDRIDGRVVEERDRPEDLRVDHFAVRPDG